MGMKEFSAEDRAEILATALPLDDIQREELLQALQAAGSEKRNKLNTLLHETEHQLHRNDHAQDERQEQNAERDDMNLIAQKILSSPTP